MKNVLVAILLVVVSDVRGQSCYADIASPNFYFATKTSYKFIKNTNTDLITLPGMYLSSSLVRILRLCINS